MDDRLTIPLNPPNPARQRLWRAVWLVLLVALGAGIGTLVYRTFSFRNHPLLWPDNAVSALRLPKTPENIRDLAQFSPQTILDTAIPLDLEHELRNSRSGVVIFFDNTGKAVGLATDQPLTVDEQGALSLFGLSTLTNSGRMSTITPQIAGVTRHTISPWLIWPTFDGTWLLLKDNKVESSPLTLTSNTLTIRGDFSAYSSDHNLALDEQTHLLAAFSAPANLANSLTPDVPAVFPGTKTLVAAMRQFGFSGLLGVDSSGIAFALGLNNAALDPEGLGSMAKELVQIQNLSTQDWTSGNMTFNELRGQEVTVDFAHDLDLNRVVATGNNGDLTRATQIGNTLIISNRIANISLKKSPVIDACLAHAIGFIAPSELRSLLSATPIYQIHDLGALLQKSQRISWSKTHLRVCL